MNKYNTALMQHYNNIWNCKDRLKLFDACGQIATVNKDFKVLEIMPGITRSMWTYATVGMAGKDGFADVELHVFSDVKNLVWLDILESIAYFHLIEARLGIGHTVNFGIAVLQYSNLTHGLISLPFLDGQDLELFSYGTQRIKCLWLIPITQSELQYKKRHGLEALERVFEKSTFSYADPMRNSVV